MAFQSDPGIIRWKVHFRSSPEKVFNALATDSGRASFWAEAAPESNGLVTFHILNYPPFTGRILERRKPAIFRIEYYGTVVEFLLSSDGRDGTDLSLTATQVDESIRVEMIAGWVSVLMAMKAAVDHDIDLRNHDKSRAWGTGFVDN